MALYVTMVAREGSEHVTFVVSFFSAQHHPINATCQNQPPRKGVSSRTLHGVLQMQVAINLGAPVISKMPSGSRAMDPKDDMPY